MKTVLFVCTGNTCRSPMAAGLFNAAAAREGLEITAQSCGISAFVPAPVSEDAVKTAAGYGADISGHRAVQVSETLVGASDRVYCMTRGHRDALALMFPAYAARIDVLDASDIGDPFGGGAAEYAATGRQLSLAVEKLIEQLIAERNAG